MKRLSKVLVSAGLILATTSVYPAGTTTLQERASKETITKSAKAVGTGLVFTADKDRTIYVTGAISGAPFLKKASQILQMSAASKEDITLVINSPGGSVFLAKQFTTAMDMAKSRGVEIKCIVPMMAASAAFSILSHCSERYALAGAELLFHPSRVMFGGGMFGGGGQTLTSRDAAKLAKELQTVDVLELSYLMKSILDEEFDPADSSPSDKQIEFLQAYYDEKFWNPAELAKFSDSGDWVKIVVDIEGIDNVFDMGQGQGDN